MSELFSGYRRLDTAEAAAPVAEIAAAPTNGPVSGQTAGTPSADEDAKALQEAAWKAVQDTNPDLKPWK